MRRPGECLPDLRYSTHHCGQRTKHAWSYGVYVQDEWKIVPTLVLNYGARWDQFKAFDSEGQISPRVNLVWTPTYTTTVHAGYSRYFSPPPFELVATTDIALFDNTTSAADHTDTTPKAERADYYDVGVSQVLADGFTVGLDSFYKASHNLIDEGQFGAPISDTLQLSIGAAIWPGVRR